jgi:CRISPR/Cas system-associated exonuclease Cas4 (RecB family)
MKLTFTKLDTYKACPLRFRLKYQAKLPEAPLRSRNLSLILHRTLQAFLFHARRDPGLHALLRAYETYCPQPQDLKQQQRYQEGRHALEAFHREQGDRLATAVALEQAFSVYLAGIEIAGRLDCALETEAGLELMDFKFTSQVPPSLDPLQLQLYSLGLKEVTGSTSDILTYYYLRQGKRVSFPGGEAAIQEGKDRVNGLVRRLQGEQEFAPSTGAWCGTCSYRRYCPTQRQHPDPIPPMLVQARLPL